MPDTTGTAVAFAGDGVFTVAAGAVETTGVAVAFAGDATFTANAGAVETTGVRVSFAGAGSFVPSIPPHGRRRRVVVTDLHGGTIGEIENAKLGAITFELNRPETWAMQILQNDPKAHLIMDVPFREVQVWRGDQLLAWGPAVRPAMDKQHFVVNCAGAMWHLSRRFIGKANRHNWVSNGSFEDGLTGWYLFTNPVKIFYGEPEAQPQLPDATITTFPKVTGTRSLTMSNFVNQADAGIGQQFEFTVDPAYSPEGDTFTLKAYALLDAIIDGNTAWSGWGMTLERFSTTQPCPVPAIIAVLPDAKLSLQQTHESLDESTPVGVWQRLEAQFTLPPSAGDPETIYVRLYAPANQVVHWDEVSLTLIERLVFYGADQASIAQGIVEHLQDAAYEKSDVNIATNCPPTGVLRTRVYVHSEHPPGFGALEEFATLDDGFDFSMAYTPTTRTFTTHYPHRGTVKTQFALDLGTPAAPGNITDFTWSFDGETAASSVISLGSGNGSSREEGFALDTSAFSEGLTLEQVSVAPTETNVDSLYNIAAERLIVAKNPVSLEVSTTPGQLWAADPVGLLWPGDSVPVTIRRHALDINAVAYRVVRLILNPNDSLNLTLNLRADLL